MFGSARTRNQLEELLAKKNASGDSISAYADAFGAGMYLQVQNSRRYVHGDDRISSMLRNIFGTSLEFKFKVEDDMLVQPPDIIHITKGAENR